jgi:gluconate kinase
MGVSGCGKRCAAAAAALAAACRPAGRLCLPQLIDVYLVSPYCSTVAALLAERLSWPMLEGDAYHPPANIAKMQVGRMPASPRQHAAGGLLLTATWCSNHAAGFLLPLVQAGVPLEDEDRWPWLQQLSGIVQRHVAACQPLVLSCSALKPAYRHLLRTGRRSSCGGVGSRCSSAEDDAVAFVSTSWRHRPSTQRPGCFPPLCCATCLLPRPVPLASPCDQHYHQNSPQVLLDPPRELLEERLQQRATAGAHFMPAALLDSQLAALQYEVEELYMHVCGTPFPQTQQIVEAVLQRLQGQQRM